MSSVLQWDVDLFRAIHLARNPGLDWVFWLLNTSGLGWIQAGAILFWGWRWPEHRAVARLVFWGGVVCGLLRLPLMSLADRMRPSNYEWAFPMEEVFGRSSFPSGHTSTSFAIGFVLWLAWRGTAREKWAWLVLLWALGVGVARIYAGVHYPSDVLGGACWGAISAAIIWLLAPRLRIDPSPETSRIDAS